MLKPNGGFYLVYVLSTLSTGAVKIPYQISRIDFDLNGIIYQRIHLI
jgi:hypothetical protein